MTPALNGIQSAARIDSPHVNASMRAADVLQKQVTRTAQAREAAEKLVSSAFVLPALESLQNSPIRPKDGPFAAGVAERRFAPLLHAEFADRVTQASNFGLVESIVERFTGRPQSRLAVYA